MRVRVVVVLVAVLVSSVARVAPAFALTKCDLRFDLEGWSVFYKESKGRGVIDCDNGQRAQVALEVRGGGITFGRHEIVDGKGEFSLISDIGEVFGNYATAEAHAGMGPSTGALVVTKGSVSLALSGTGTGVDIGFAFGRFTIRPAADVERREGVEARDEPPPPVHDGPIGDEDLPAGDPAPPGGY
jgi:hypothetical protein